MIGAPGFKETVAAAGLELLDGEAARDGRRRGRLRPPRVRLRGAADRDPRPAARGDAVRRPAATRPCRCPAAPGPGPARCWPRSRPPPEAAPRSAASPSRHLFEQAAGADPRRRRGWRWSATGSPPTSRAGAGPAWRRSSSSAAPPRARRRRRPSPPPDHVIDDLAGAAAMSAEPRRARRFRPGVAFAGDLRRHLLRPARGRRRAAGAAPLRARPARRRQHRGRHRDRLLRGRPGCCCAPSPAASPTAAAASRPSWSARCWSPSPASSTCCRSGSPGLIGARLVLGAGEGTVFTAGSAWIVDLAPPDRRGRVIGLYGLAVWAGLSVGPLIGELLLHASGYSLVWLFAGAMPLVGAAIASRIPDPYRPQPALEDEHHPLIAREAVRPGRRAGARLDRLRDGRRLRRPPPRRARGRPRRGRLRRLRDDGRPHPPGRRRPPRPGRARPGWRSRRRWPRRSAWSTIGVAHSLPVALAGALAMGDRLLAALPLALADRRRARPGDAPRRGARHLHRLLRRRRRPRRAARRGRRGAHRLRGRLPALGGDRRRLATTIACDRARAHSAPRPSARAKSSVWTARPIRRGGRRAPTRRCRRRSAAAG